MAPFVTLAAMQDASDLTLSELRGDIEILNDDIAAGNDALTASRNYLSLFQGRSDIDLHEIEEFIGNRARIQSLESSLATSEIGGLLGDRYLGKATAIEAVEREVRLARAILDFENTDVVVTAANNDGLKGVDTKSPRSLSISDELDKASDAFFGSSKNAEYFLKTDRYEGSSPSESKPVFCGSDAHSFDDLARLSADEAGHEATWIKADLTFRDLRQTLFEPKGRSTKCERCSSKIRKLAGRTALAMQGRNGKGSLGASSKRPSDRSRMVAEFGNKARMVSAKRANYKRQDAKTRWIGWCCWTPDGDQAVGGLFRQEHLSGFSQALWK